LVLSLGSGTGIEGQADHRFEKAVEGSAGCSRVNPLRIFQPKGNGFPKAGPGFSF
jgi:hypothetical protein